MAKDYGFGNSMEKTLIKLNKFRSSGVPICDDPTNHHRPMVIEADLNIHILMSMVGYTCGFIARFSTDDDIETCRHITISNVHYWGPTKHIFVISSMDKEQSGNVFNLISINQVRS